MLIVGNHHLLALHENAEVLVHDVPFLVLPSTLLLIVSKEIALHLLMVKEVKLLIDERCDTHTTDGLGPLNHGTVELSFGIILWFGKNVDAQILPACHLHRLWIADGRVEVKIQGQASVGDGASE